MTQPASISDFKAYFDRDFRFGEGVETVRDTDIQKGFDQTDVVFNTGLWVSDAESKIPYLNAAAHFLALNLQAAGGLEAAGKAWQGSNSHGGGIIQNKSVGQVSVAYALPQSLVDSPTLNQFMRTDYGQAYLQMLTPRLVGGGFAVEGWDDVTI